MLPEVKIIGIGRLMVKITKILLAIVIVALLAAGTPFLLSRSPLYAQDEKNPYLVRTFLDEGGREIDEIIDPGRPPEIKAEVIIVPESNFVGTSLSHVPAFDWSYGCSATSAAMLVGYYDNDGYHTNMYAGPTNAGAPWTTQRGGRQSGLVVGPGCGTVSVH